MKDELQSGAEIFDKVIGPGKAEAMLESFADICPEFGEMFLKFALTDIYQRPGLELKIREFIIFLSLITKGYPTPQIKGHLKGALNTGAKKQEIIELILQLIPYVGFGGPIAAMNAAKEVFAEYDNKK